MYSQAAGQGPSELPPVRPWGKFTRYLEVGADGYAVRQVDVFANGYALRYDRSHWADDLGTLADARYRPGRWRRWWPATRLTAAEFERVWAEAASSPARQLQIATAQMAVLGVVPFWLAREP